MPLYPGVGSNVSPSRAALMLLNLPRNTITPSLIPLPVVKLRLGVPFSVSVPLMAASVISRSLVPASMSVIDNALGPVRINGVFESVNCALGTEFTGASLTAVTVTSNVSLVVVVPSLTVTVIVTGPPFWFVAAAASIVQFPPPRFTSVRLPFGIMVVFPLTAVTVSDPAVVSKQSLICFRT